jgi:hypothetical protein
VVTTAHTQCTREVKLWRSFSLRASVTSQVFGRVDSLNWVLVMSWLFLRRTDWTSRQFDKPHKSTHIVFSISATLAPCEIFHLSNKQDEYFASSHTRKHLQTTHKITARINIFSRNSLKYVEKRRKQYFNKHRKRNSTAKPTRNKLNVKHTITKEYTLQRLWAQIFLRLNRNTLQET